MHKFILLPLGLAALADAQSSVAQVTDAPPPAPVLLNSTKSGVIPSLPTGTPFAGVDTLQGAIISPLPPLPGYTGLLGTASEELNQPAATYVATMPDSMYNPLVDTVVSGTIQAVSGPDGVTFTVNLSDLPSQSEYGPFNWHIHNMAVPADGNCTATMGHFDPTNRGELYMCDASQPATCQVGDLAGKHGGKIMTDGSFTTTFVDPYLSTVEGSQGYFGGLSFVLHSKNTTRLTCANFEVMSGGNGTNATGTMSMPSATSSNTPEFTGAAGQLRTGAAALIVGFAAAML